MHDTDRKGRITTAVLLAAGTGSRLRPLTNDMPKCLTTVNEIPILDRLVHCLHQYDFQHLIVVVGYFEQSIRNHLDKIAGNLTVEYIVSSQYRTTNNIYSLWLARDKIHQPFVLLECDLIFNPPLLEGMLLPDRIAVSPILPWMNGTTVTTDRCIPHHVTAFNVGSHSNTNDIRYKTVNIYSFSLLSWRRIAKRLDSYISAGKVNVYYESVFAEMVADGTLNFQCVFFDTDRWYEIDTLQDLHECEQMFQDYSFPLKSWRR